MEMEALCRHFADKMFSTRWNKTVALGPMARCNTRWSLNRLVDDGTLSMRQIASSIPFSSTLIS